MDYDYGYTKSRFFKAMMTGVFAGLITTLISFVYDLVYRDSTGFPLPQIINVSSLIFIINLLFWGLGFVYYFLLKASRVGDILFIVLVALLTVFFAWRSAGVIRSVHPEMVTQFRTLLIGLIIIIGGCAAILMPLLYHNRQFQKHVI